GPAFAARSLSALEHKDTAFRPRSVRARHGAIGLLAFFRCCPKRHTSTKSTPTRNSTSTPTREAPPGSASSPNSGRPTRPNSRPRARTPVPAAGAQAQREVLDTQRNVLGSRRTNHAAESDGSSQSDARSAETKPPKSTATPGSARHQLAPAIAPARPRSPRRRRPSRCAHRTTRWRRRSARCTTRPRVPRATPRARPAPGTRRRRCPSFRTRRLRALRGRRRTRWLLAHEVLRERRRSRFDLRALRDAAVDAPAARDRACVRVVAALGQAVCVEPRLHRRHVLVREREGLRLDGLPPPPLQQ